MDFRYVYLDHKATLMSRAAGRALQVRSSEPLQAMKRLMRRWRRATHCLDQAGYPRMKGRTGQYARNCIPCFPVAGRKGRRCLRRNLCPWCWGRTRVYPTLRALLHLHSQDSPVRVPLQDLRVGLFCHQRQWTPTYPSYDASLVSAALDYPWKVNGKRPDVLGGIQNSHFRYERRGGADSSLLAILEVRILVLTGPWPPPAACSQRSNRSRVEEGAAFTQGIWDDPTADHPFRGRLLESIPTLEVMEQTFGSKEEGIRPLARGYRRCDLSMPRAERLRTLGLLASRAARYPVEQLVALNDPEAAWRMWQFMEASKGTNFHRRWGGLKPAPAPRKAPVRPPDDPDGPRLTDHRVRRRPLVDNHPDQDQDQ